MLLRSQELLLLVMLQRRGPLLVLVQPVHKGDVDVALVGAPELHGHADGSALQGRHVDVDVAGVVALVPRPADIDAPAAFVALGVLLDLFARFPVEQRALRWLLAEVGPVLEAEALGHARVDPLLSAKVLELHDRCPGAAEDRVCHPGSMGRHDEVSRVVEDRCALQGGRSEIDGVDVEPDFPERLGCRLGVEPVAAPDLPGRALPGAAELHEGAAALGPVQGPEPRDAVLRDLLPDVRGEAPEDRRLLARHAGVPLALCEPVEGPQRLPHEAQHEGLEAEGLPDGQGGREVAQAVQLVEHPLEVGPRPPQQHYAVHGEVDVPPRPPGVGRRRDVE